jgi:hypothetical protein
MSDDESVASVPTSKSDADSEAADVEMDQADSSDEDVDSRDSDRDAFSTHHDEWSRCYVLTLNMPVGLKVYVKARRGGDRPWAEHAYGQSASLASNSNGLLSTLTRRDVDLRSSSDARGNLELSGTALLKATPLLGTHAGLPPPTEKMAVVSWAVSPSDSDEDVATTPLRMYLARMEEDMQEKFKEDAETAFLVDRERSLSALDEPTKTTDRVDKATAVSLVLRPVESASSRTTVQSVVEHLSDPYRVDPRNGFSGEKWFQSYQKALTHKKRLYGRMASDRRKEVERERKRVDARRRSFSGRRADKGGGEDARDDDDDDDDDGSKDPLDGPANKGKSGVSFDLYAQKESTTNSLFAAIEEEATYTELHQRATRLLASASRAAGEPTGVEARCKKLADTLGSFAADFPHYDALLEDIAGFVVAFTHNHLIAETKHVNYVIFGPPGTGKSYMAVRIARVFTRMGHLMYDEVMEGDRSKLVAEYMGQTAPKAKAFLTSCLERVGFMDEAYNLTQWTTEGGGQRRLDSYSSEAVAEILVHLSTNAGRTTLIVAGYQEEMENDFLAANRGLDRRFENRILTGKEPVSRLLDILTTTLSEKFVKNYVDECVFPENAADDAADRLAAARELSAWLGQAGPRVAQQKRLLLESTLFDSAATVEAVRVVTNVVRTAAASDAGQHRSVTAPIGKLMWMVRDAMIRAALLTGVGRTPKKRAGEDADAASSREARQAQNLYRELVGLQKDDRDDGDGDGDDDDDDDDEGEEDDDGGDQGTALRRLKDMTKLTMAVAQWSLLHYEVATSRLTSRLHEVKELAFLGRDNGRPPKITPERRRQLLTLFRKSETWPSADTEVNGAKIKTPDFNPKLEMELLDCKAEHVWADKVKTKVDEFASSVEATLSLAPSRGVVGDPEAGSVVFRRCARVLFTPTAMAFLNFLITNVQKAAEERRKRVRRDKDTRRQGKELMNVFGKSDAEMPQEDRARVEAVQNDLRALLLRERDESTSGVDSSKPPSLERLFAQQASSMVTLANDLVEELYSNGRPFENTDGKFRWTAPPVDVDTIVGLLRRKQERMDPASVLSSAKREVDEMRTKWDALTPQAKLANYCSINRVLAREYASRRAKAPKPQRVESRVELFTKLRGKAAFSVTVNGASDVFTDNSRWGKACVALFSSFDRHNLQTKFKPVFSKLKDSAQVYEWRLAQNLRKGSCLSLIVAFDQSTLRERDRLLRISNAPSERHDFSSLFDVYREFVEMYVKNTNGAKVTPTPLEASVPARKRPHSPAEEAEPGTSRMGRRREGAHESDAGSAKGSGEAGPSGSTPRRRSRATVSYRDRSHSQSTSDEESSSQAPPRGDTPMVRPEGAEPVGYLRGRGRGRSGHTWNARTGTWKPNT